MAGELRDNRGRGEAEWRLPPIHPEGRKFGTIAVGLALVFLLLLDWEIVGWPLLLLSAGIFAFFRDPERVVPQGDNSIVSPADGQVSLIVQVPPPVELQGADGDGGEGLGPSTKQSLTRSWRPQHLNTPNRLRRSPRRPSAC